MASGPAGLNAFADPDFFLCQQLVSLCCNGVFLGELLLFLQLVLREVARIRAQLAPIQLDDAGGHPIQKDAIMGNGDNTAAEIYQQFFKPFDRVQVQVVGRLIQQQYIGPGNQCLCECHSLACATREISNARLWIQMQALQGFFYPLLPVPGIVGFNLCLQRIQIDSVSPTQVLIAQRDDFSQAFGSSFENGCGWI